MNREDESGDKRWTRRDFLRFLGVMAGSGLVTGAFGSNFDSPDLQDKPVSEGREDVVEAPVFSSEKILGVEVFGLNTPIKDRSEYFKLQAENEKQFLAKLPESERGINSWEQRERVYGNEVRTYEIVVRQSEFNDPERGSENQHPDFVTRMLMQQDLINRIIENSAPGLNLRAKLLRIVVVDDSFNPDSKPAFINPRDVDATWFEKIDRWGGHFWNVTNTSEGLVVERATGTHKFPKMVLAGEKDSLVAADGVYIDTMTIHELFHYLFQFVDEYTAEVDMVDEDAHRFTSFQVATGTIYEPTFSPFIETVMRQAQSLEVRGECDHPHSVNVSEGSETWLLYGNRPGSIALEVSGASQVQLFPVRMNGTYHESSKGLSKRDQDRLGKVGADQFDRYIEDVPDQSIQGGSIVFDNGVYAMTKAEEYYWDVPPYPAILPSEDYPSRMIDVVPTVVVVKAQVGGETKELHLPTLALVMSKLAGRDSVNYRVEFSGQDDEEAKTLYVDVIDKNELAEYVAQIGSDPDQTYYARMEIEGTDSVLVWFQQKPAKMNWAGVGVVPQMPTSQPTPTQ